MPESKWVAQQLGRPVIKAFNNIYASRLLESGRPKGAASRIALPVSGDDQAAKAIVLKLVDELGFDGVDAGKLDDTTNDPMLFSAIFLSASNTVASG